MGPQSAATFQREMKDNAAANRNKINVLGHGKESQKNYIINATNWGCQISK